MSPLTAFSLRSVLYTGLPTSRGTIIAGAAFQGCLGWLFITFPCWTENSHSAGGSEQTTEAHNLSGKEKRGGNTSERPKAGRLLLARRTHVWDMSCFPNASTISSTPWRQVVCWGSLVDIQQHFILNPSHCESSSLLHSFEHCIDPRTQYFFTSVLDRVPNSWQSWEQALDMTLRSFGP